MEQRREEKLLTELRTQVNDLLAAASMLTPLVQDRGGERDLESLCHMNKGLYRMIRTVNHLDLCWNAEPVFHPRPLDLLGLCRRIGMEVEGISRDLEVSFRWEVEERELQAVADETLLEQAILNMLTNAFQKAGPGGKVRLRATAEKGRFTAVVWDNGPGLTLPDPEANPLLKEEGGPGLGLEAARRVASLHGGALVLENGEGGVRAILSMPIRNPDGNALLRDGGMGYARDGGFSQLLVEFSPLLSYKCYSPEDVE